MDDQLEEVADMFITPLLDVPSKFNGYDAYTRQSNVLISAFEKLVDEYHCWVSRNPKFTTWAHLA